MQKNYFMPHEVETLFEDIIRVVRDIETFSQGVTMMGFSKNRMLQSAIERQIEIIGEALYRMRKLDAVTFSKITDADRIVAMRNIIAHGYDTVDLEIVWAVVHHFTQILKVEIEGLMNQK